MKYKINKGFIVQKIDEKSTIFDGEKSALYTLNETATFIFNKLKKGYDEEKIISQVAKKYSIKKELVKKDFNELLTDLKRKKIVLSSL